MTRRLMAMLLAAVLVAAACGSDDGSEPTEAADATATTATPEEVDETTTTTDVAEEPTEDTTPEPLTASFRGVSDSEIKIGVGFVDASEFGFDAGDIEAKWQAAIDAVNEAGGVNGRQLVPVYGSFSPLGAAEADEVCVRFVEDEMVFAFVGFVRNDSELCYTEFNETIAVNADAATNDAISRSNGLLYSSEATILALELLAIDAADEAGLIEGEQIQINAVDTEESLVEPVREALEGAGAEITGVVVTTVDRTDVPAAEAENDTFALRAEADDATTIWAIAEAGLGTTGAVQRTGIDVVVITTHDLPNVYLNFGYDPGAIDLRVFAPESREALYEQGEVGLPQCVERFEEASGEIVNTDPDTDPNNFNPTVRACRGIDLFVAIATAAGPDLTNESFLAAADSLGSFALTGATAASMAEGKVGADDSPAIALTWDDDTQTFVPVS